MKLRELAELLDGRVSGDPDIEITGVSGINEAQKGDITYLDDKKNIETMIASNASAILLKTKIEGISAQMVFVDNPQYAFALALEIFYKKPYKSSGISDKSVICEKVDLGKDVTIFPFAYLGSNSVIGDRTTIFSGSYIGEGVTIGNDSVIYPNVTIREGVRIGENVIIHSGAVIGADGFGYVMEKGAHYKIPQVGGVIIEDFVEIGANAVIDRATTGNTFIGTGTKIDNLVQIAHNVKIGRNCIIVSQVGISGSVEVGDGSILAGQVGVRDHVRIGNKVIVAARAGIVTNLSDGQIYSGSPAIPHHKSLRAQSLYGKLPDLMQRIRKLERLLIKEENSDDG